MDDNDLRIGQGIDAPQWSLRFGGIVNKKIFNNKFQWGIEWNYDHAKYVLKQGQRVRMKGQIGGYQYDQDTTINRNFIEYEHTDGANYYMLNFVLKRNLGNEENSRHDLDLLLKAGGGMVIPRTDSKIMGNHYNKHYHVAGYLMGIESSLRYELIRNFFAELSIKGVYANYRDVLLYGDGRARQDWFSGQYLFTVSYQLPIRKKISE